MEDKLKPEWIVFCKQYVIDYNATRSYMFAYPDSDYDSSSASASRLLRNVKITDYIDHIQKDLSKLSGVTALRNVLELKKLAYTNIADFKKDWLTLEEFNSLDDDTKAAISEISHTETTFGKDGKKETIKFRLHDKTKAIEILNKMLGFNEPEKHNVTGSMNIINLGSGNESEKE